MSGVHVELLLQSAVGTVLVGAAVAKLWSRSSVRPFLTALGLPEVLAGIVAWSLVPAELGCGLLLLAGSAPLAVYAAAALCATFAVLLVAAQVMGVTEGCRCFGALDGPRITPVTITRALVMAVAALAAAIAAPGGAPSLDRAAGEAIALGAGAGVAYVAIFALAAQVYGFEQGRAGVQRRALAATGGETG